jgi:hypothetical protein
MNRKVIIGIGVLFALCCICSVVTVGAQVKTMRDFISVLKPPTFSEKIGVGACDEFKYDGLGGEDRAGMTWNNGAWLFIVGAKSAADRDAILRALPY